MVEIDLYCEDEGHELFATAMVRRLGKDLKRQTRITARSNRGGHGKAITELKQWQRALRKGIGGSRGDILVVIIDANSDGWGPSRNAVQQEIDEKLFARSVVGCPDPHVERWCFADPQALQDVTGIAPPPDPGNGGRHFYKAALSKALQDAGIPVLDDPMEISSDVVERMDLYAAGQRQQSLNHFIRDLRGAMLSVPH